MCRIHEASVSDHFPLEERASESFEALREEPITLQEKHTNC